MTDEPREEPVGEAAAEPTGPAASAAGPGPDGAAAKPGAASRPREEREPEKPKIVIKDNRKVSPHGTATAPAGQGDGAASEPAGTSEAGTTEAGTTEASTTEAPASDEASQQLDELRAGLEELTRDLQRVSAEYANYRKRVDRDRTLVADQAVGSVLTQLLPVLDDLDRARSHGDLVGPFAAVAEQLTTALGKFGLTPFGDVGDPFDPTLHEAVSHTSSPDVTETSCVEIMRRGYLLGERLLRPALVAVADPAGPQDQSEQAQPGEAQPGEAGPGDV